MPHGPQTHRHAGTLKQLGCPQVAPLRFLDPGQNRLLRIDLDSCRRSRQWNEEGVFFFRHVLLNHNGFGDA
jgi:hypothetical protein